MKFHELKVASKGSPKRVGRGISAGQGKTAGRGTKGQRSRTGSSKKPGFAGGQLPLMQRLPKLPGFRSIRVPMENVYTGQLDAIKGVIDNFSLADASVTSSPYVRVKLVVKGDVTKKADVKLQAASEAAIAAVQKAGGTFAAVDQVKRSKLDKNEKTEMAAKPARPAAKKTTKK
jgi:large subunit ribosomal protein L15